MSSTTIEVLEAPDFWNVPNDSSGELRYWGDAGLLTTARGVAVSSTIRDRLIQRYGGDDYAPIHQKVGTFADEGYIRWDDPIEDRRRRLRNSLVSMMTSDGRGLNRFDLVEDEVRVHHYILEERQGEIYAEGENLMPLRSVLSHDSWAWRLEALGTEEMIQHMESGESNAVVWLSPASCQFGQEKSGAVNMAIRDDKTQRWHSFGFLTEANDKVYQDLAFGLGLWNSDSVLDDLKARAAGLRVNTDDYDERVQAVGEYVSQIEPRLAGVMRSIVSGRARRESAQYDAWLEDIDSLLVDFVRSGDMNTAVDIQSRMEQKVDFRDLEDGCTLLLSQSQVVEASSHFMGGDGAWLSEDGELVVPSMLLLPKRFPDISVGGERYVWVEKCGFHTENGGDCDVRFGSYLQVGSCCPGCKRKFECA